MKVKILSMLIAVVFASLFFVSCGENKGSGSNDMSSKAAEQEFSSQVTSSENDVSSKKDTASVSLKDNSSKKEETTSKQTSSKKGTVSRDSGNKTESKTESQSVKLPVSPSKARGIGVYHFEPSWTDHYAEEPTTEQRYEEFEDVLKAGYFNTVIGFSNDERFWEICEKYNVTVWTNLWSLYDTKSTNATYNNLDNYLKMVENQIAKIKADPKRWERFQGFHFEEPIWRGQKNEDYLAVTKALYQKYGKRNFVVFATGVLTGVEGNEQQLGQSADANKKVLPFALEYTTDVSFDSYSVDVRDGAPNGDFIERMRKEANLPNIVDGKSYFREIANLVLRLTGHPANIWFFPTAYKTNLWGGLTGDWADEEYCIAHLEFFHDLLNEYDFQGGLILYNYQKFSNEHALAEVLVVRDENGDYKLCPDYEGKKWTDYSMLIKKITEEYKTTSANILTNVLK